MSKSYQTIGPNKRSNRLMMEKIEKEMQMGLIQLDINFDNQNENDEINKE